MKKKISIFILSVVLFLTLNNRVYAIEDPLKVPNNIFGVHILFSSELDNAAKIVNSSNGDWGYIIIPVQSGDKDLIKWQDFMNHAKEAHLIPILRLATEGDYFNTSVWRKPVFTDILDFANFLDSLVWPTKNKYIIVYNEPNRADEWGGNSNPQEYANILSYAVTAFKTKDPDFFIISAGLDNAAATENHTYDEYTFLTDMNIAIPGIFNQIDGLGSHAYANPGFSQPPSRISNESITSFRYESNLVDSFTAKKLPIFITETGWSREKLSEDIIANYYPIAFKNVWNDNRIVVVTPFLLEAGKGPFINFSLLKNDGSDSLISQAIKNIPKIKGTPVTNPEVLAAESFLDIHSFPIKKFTDIKNARLDDSQFLSSIKTIAKYLLHI